MQSITVNFPQNLRLRLQRYQNEYEIVVPEKAILAALEAYFDIWKPTDTESLPPMYDAEDGPCEVLDSFKE